MTILQPVKQGLSAPVVTSIPQQWSAQWFRSFITNYLQNADIRNATTGGGVSVTSTNFTQPASIGLSPIAGNTVLGSVEPGLNPPQSLTETQLTSLIKVFTMTTSGAVPAAPQQDPTLFLNATGTFTQVPVPNIPAATGYAVVIPSSWEDPDDGGGVAVIPGPMGPQGPAGTGGSGGPAVVLLQQEEPEDYMLVPGQIGPKGNTGATGAPGANGLALPQFIYPEDPEDPAPPIPGVPGPQGGVGPIGLQGVPVQPYADDPDDPLVIPGPTGSRGATGLQGAQFVIYPEDPNDTDFPPLPGVPGPVGAPGLQGYPIIWQAEDLDDATLLPVTMFGVPTARVGLTAISGVLTTAMRSDAAPAIDQSIVPTWTGAHTFTPSSGNVQIHGLASNQTLFLQGSATLNQSFGALIYAGTSASDTALWVRNQAATSTLLQVNGDGSGLLGAGMTWNAAGDVTLTGSANSYALTVNGSSTSGQSLGVAIVAGTTAADKAFAVYNKAGSETFLSLTGDGSGNAGGLGWNANGDFTIATPVSGTALSAYGASSSYTAFLQASTTTSQSYGLLICGGTNGNDPAIKVANAANTLAYFLVNGDGSGFLGNSLAGTTAQALGWDASGNVSLCSNAGSSYVYVNGAGLIVQGGNASNHYGGTLDLYNTTAISNGTKFIRINPTGGLEVVNSAYSAIVFTLGDGGSVQCAGTMGMFGAAGPANQLTGWGTPTGGTAINNYNGSTATALQTSEAVAAIILSLKSMGLFGA